MAATLVLVPTVALDAAATPWEHRADAWTPALEMRWVADPPVPPQPLKLQSGTLFDAPFRESLIAS
ncbi:hypothetical protein H5J25_04605 [Sphingomonas aliaeris]|uniref:Uncharacterized protein n=1 Tax=Sphingomonas aliaeris TaxID=2759526 RepID=A0A974S4V8_9SPHN|nr:hypothetical protein [Sphingomonas aliaeris]QQV78027.1 hypothetical protein H5J25_04605 [Sphingomonas aliaeris]